MPLKTARLLIDKGYDVELAIIAVKPEISYLSTIKRYEEMINKQMIARLTRKEDHDKVVASIVNNLSIINSKNVFDNISIYDRSFNCIFTKKENKLEPGVILERNIFGIWNDKEKLEIIRIIKSTKNLKIKRNDPNLYEYLKETRELILKINLKYNKDKIQS